MARDEFNEAWERTFGGAPSAAGTPWRKLVPQPGSHVTPQMIESMLSRELAEMGIVHTAAERWDDDYTFKGERPMKRGQFLGRLGAGRGGAVRGGAGARGGGTRRSK